MTVEIKCSRIDVTVLGRGPVKFGSEGISKEGRVESSRDTFETITTVEMGTERGRVNPRRQRRDWSF